MTAHACTEARRQAGRRGHADAWQKAARWGGLWLVAGLLFGCASSPKPTADDSTGSSGEISTLERRIASAKAGLSGGVSRSSGGASPSAPAAASESGPFRRCDAVCQAAEEICTCHRRICALADEIKDGKSADSCRRSQRDCEEAGKLCAGCGG